MPAINATVAEMKDARGGSTGGWTGREEQQCPRRPIGRWRAPAPCWAPMVAGVRPELPAQCQAGSRTPPSLADLPAACPRHRRCPPPTQSRPWPFLESNIFSWSLLTFPSCPMQKRRHSRLGAQAAGLLQGHGHGRDPRAGDSVPFKTPSQKEALPGHPCAKCLRCRCRAGKGTASLQLPRQEWRSHAKWPKDRPSTMQISLETRVSLS